MRTGTKLGPPLVLVVATAGLLAIVSFFIVQSITGRDNSGQETQATLTSDVSANTSSTGRNPAQQAQATWLVNGVVHNGTISVDTYGHKDAVSTGSKTTIMVSDTGEFIDTTGWQTTLVWYAVMIGALVGASLPYVVYWSFIKARVHHVLPV